jgi:predicted ATPase/class 3 adenylate cyclase
MPVEAPSGTVTLMFTDIQGSTRLWETLGDGFRPILDRHNDLARAEIERYRGFEVKSQGDSFMVAFGDGADGVRCALAIQKALARENWPETVGELLIRIGLHTGEPILQPDPSGRPDYFGPVVNRSARIEAAAHGGQTVISGATREAIQAALGDGLAGVEFINMGTHRLRGLDDPEQIFEVRDPELGHRQFPPLRTMDTMRTNLPESRTTFVGRHKEISELRRLISRQETRLVTLIGFGGMGKTRTALNLAERCTYDFEHGVWWIECEEATTSDEMIQRIAFQLRMHLEPQPSVREQLLAYLKERELLLMLDNTEQIPDAGKVITELLNAAKGVKCVVTTRRALEISHEVQIEIPPLPLEDAEALFLDRASSRRADFERTPENAADIARLCQELECVPLALELAASRIVGMSPREVLSRLGEQLRLLQTRAPDLPPRQRALRGAIDWSYDLLTDDDKSLFAQLSVFAGGFTLDNVEEVCESFDPFEGVMELRRQSLLRAQVNPNTQITRYVMLESVRAYAAEKLEDVLPDPEDLRRRHAEYFLKFAEKWAGRMRTREEAKALEELRPSYDNIRAALAWADRNEETEVAARLALVLYQMLYRRGFWAEARRTLQTGLEAAERSFEDSRKLQATLRHYLGALDIDTGDEAGAREHVDASLALRRELGDQAGIAESLNLLAILAIEGKRLDEAQALLDEALALLPERDHQRRAIILHNMGRVASGHGDASESRRLYELALRHRRAGGDARGEAETLGNLGVLAFNAGELDEARRLYLESLAILRRLQDRHWTAVMLYNLAELAVEQGDPERAILFFVHSERLFRELQSPYVAAPAAGLKALSEQFEPEDWQERVPAAAARNWEDEL